MMRRPLSLLVRLSALVPVFLFTFVLGAGLFPPALPEGVTPEAGPFSPLVTHLVVAATQVGVVALLVLRSRAGGWRLALPLALGYYGCTTFLAQVETAFFLVGRTVPPDALVNLFLMGVPPALIFVPMAVWLLGPARPPDAAPAVSAPMPAGQWAWKLALLSVAYVGLYLSAGYYIAWRNPELRALYGGTDPGGFVAMLRTTVAQDAWLIPLQLARGLGWVAFALPLLRGFRAGTWMNALAVACLVALPMNVGHLYPNPFIPPMSVRLSHFLETASSNFVFGVLVVWLLHRPHASIADLFRTARRDATAPALAPAD